MTNLEILKNIMKHKFYYYEYSDDGGVTWTMGDYRRYLMPIVELANQQPYRFRIRNQNDIEVDPHCIAEALDQIKLANLVFGKEAQL
jgi:hypothetical protein